MTAKDFKPKLDRSIFKATITNAWMCTDTLDLYFDLLKVRARSGGLKIYAFPAMAYQFLICKGKMSLLGRHINDYEESFDSDLVFLPITADSHFSLLVLDLKTKVAELYDSGHIKNWKAANVLIEYFLSLKKRQESKRFCSKERPLLASNNPTHLTVGCSYANLLATV